MVVNLAAVALCNFHLFAAWLFQDQGSVGWDPISLWKQMGILAKSRGYHSVHHVRLVDRRDD